MNEEKLNQVIETQARMQEQIKTLFRTQAEIKELTETVRKLAIALEKQGMAIQSTDKNVGEVRRDVDEIKQKPAKRWDAVIAAIISAIVGFALAKLGIK